MKRLNVGCGNRRISGYVGVDIVSRPGADIVAPADNIPLPEGSVSEILAIHLWEHFYLWECDKVLTEWKRLLCPRGLLVLELPNIEKAARNLLEDLRLENKHPDQLSMWALYGDPRSEDPHMNHRWGWSPKTLNAYLSRNGFDDVVETETQWHPVGRGIRDMRIQARKV